MLGSAFLESDFTKEHKGYGNPVGPSGPGLEGFGKGDQRKRGIQSKGTGVPSQLGLCVHRHVSF